LEKDVRKRRRMKEEQCSIELIKRLQEEDERDL